MLIGWLIQSNSKISHCKNSSNPVLQIISDVSTFRLTDSSWRSYHRLTNDTELFINVEQAFTKPVRTGRFHLTNQWVLQDPVTNRYYNYANSRVNHIHEWNPGKIGWMKSGSSSFTKNNVSWVKKFQFRVRVVVNTCIMSFGPGNWMLKLALIIERFLLLLFFNCENVLHLGAPSMY